MTSTSLSAEVAAPRRPRVTRRSLREKTIFVLLAAPNIALILAFTYRPLLMNMYYSTLDWHDERATGPSTPPARENDNLIPKAYEDFNVAQLQELVSGYGPLSEVWFDMGHPTP